MSTKKITKVGGGEGDAPQKSTFVPTAEAKGKATQLRIISIVLWVLAIAAEIGAILVLMKSAKPITTSTWVWMIAFIVIDLILVVVGSQIWKQANRLDPASKQEAFKFFIQNQLGVIIAVIAFLPLVVLIFTNKDLEGKQKGILGGIAVLALVIAGLTSADFNPPSVEEYTQQTSQIEELTGKNRVYWTKSGTKYHIYEDCSSINTNRTDEIFEGAVAKARELKNITELCKFCENKAIKAKDLTEKKVEKNE
ncbi:MAG: OST3/OST6 family protein [Leptospirales bacterium]|nr:OST3/OST6 family protein [Leptospirales bacterium]